MADQVVFRKEKNIKKKDMVVGARELPETGLMEWLRENYFVEGEMADENQVNQPISKEPLGSWTQKKEKKGKNVPPTPKGNKKKIK